MFVLEELQKMNKNELIKIIGNYISDQEIWLNQINGLEKQIDDKNAEIEKLKKRHGVALIRNDDLDLENYELKKQVDECNRDCEKYAIENSELQQQVDELTKHLHKAVTLIKENSDLWFKYKFDMEVE